MSGKLRIIATGPESSGTNYVGYLLEAGGAEVLHRSQPNGTDWLDFKSMLDYPASGYDAPTQPVARVVIVIRGRLAHLSSQVRRNIAVNHRLADERRRASLAGLANLLGDPRVLVVTYESLAARAERAHLLRSLHLDESAADAVEYHDQNGQYYS